MNNSRFLLIACFILFGISPACNKDDDPKQTGNIPCLPANLSAHVIAFYPFSNGSLNDFSGNGIDLSNNTTAKVAPDRSGNPACAFEFDNFPKNVDSLVATNTQKLNSLQEFSVSLWYQPLDTLVQDSTPKIESMVRHGKWDIVLYDCRKAVFALSVNNTTGYSVWDTNLTAFNPTNWCQEEQKLRTGTWHHLVVTFNSAKNVAKIYRDNVLHEAGSSEPLTSSPTNIISLLIGSGFTGRMDDIAIFNKALDAAEINSLFNTAPCCTVP